MRCFMPMLDVPTMLTDGDKTWFVLADGRRSFKIHRMKMFSFRDIVISIALQN